MENIFTNYQGVLRKNYNLAHLTWLKVGGNADFFYKPKDMSDLQNFLQQIPDHVELNIIGAGSNLLIRDGGIRGVVVKLGSQFNYIELKDDVIRVGASTLNYHLAHFAYQNSITGMEFLLGIPGTIGGGIAMNAGSYGQEFKDILCFVTAVDRNGRIVRFSNQEMGFVYRCNSLDQQFIFLQAEISVTKGMQNKIKDLMDHINFKRSISQPVNAKTAGSTFANPLPHKAWELIDKVGMKGYTLNGAQFSDLHCNFLLNLGNATAADLESLGEMARFKVLSHSGIELKWEVKRIGLP